METLSKRVLRLEKEMADLKLQLKAGRAVISDVEMSYKAVMLDFIRTYGLDVPDCLKQTGSHP